MLHISHHAVYRFVQRYHKRRVHYKALSMADYENAKSMLAKMLTEATLDKGDRYVCQDFILVCKDNTVITVYPKNMKRGLTK